MVVTVMAVMMVNMAMQQVEVISYLEGVIGVRNNIARG